MPAIDVVIDLTPQECLAYYHGDYAFVRTRSTDGRSVVFPADALRRVVGEDGVHGIYRLTFSAQGRFMSIQRLLTN